MRKLRGAAVAALVLSVAGQASAAVLFEKTGEAYFWEGFYTAEEWNPFLDEYGGIEIVVNWTTPPTGPIGAMFFDSHRKYVDGHEETLNGELVGFTPGQSGGGYAPGWTYTATASGFTLRITDRRDYHCQDWQPWVNCKWDTLRDIRASWQEHDRDPMGYSLTVSSAPEPATWAMLIAGFGLVGGALRSRRPVHLA